MRDFSGSPYPNLLKFLEDGYMYDTDSTNYVDLLLSLAPIGSIKNLMEVYSRTSEKIECFRSMPFSYTYRLEKVHDELDMFVNDKLLAYYINETEHTDQDLYACLANLVLGKNYDQTRKSLMQQNERLKDTANRIHNSKVKLDNIRSEQKEQRYPLDSNGYKMLKNEYLQLMEFLNGVGYEKTPDIMWLENCYGIQSSSSKKVSKKSRSIKKTLIFFAVAGCLLLVYFLLTNFQITAFIIFIILFVLTIIVTLFRPDI
ncbi:MAG: hypothetical protein J5565_05010 [Muribaculaceae bacterium]|nr:hypothetical protein [Muribaculaceae bacterium]